MRGTTKRPGIKFFDTGFEIHQTRVEVDHYDPELNWVCVSFSSPVYSDATRLGRLEVIITDTGNLRVFAEDREVDLHHWAFKNKGKGQET